MDINVKKVHKMNTESRHGINSRIGIDYLKKNGIDKF